MKFHEMPYERVQLPDVTHAYEELIKELQAAKSGEEQFAVHQRYYEMRGHVMTQMTIANIRHDIDMTDAFYEKEQEYYDEIGPEVQNLEQKYRKCLYESPYRAYLEEKIGPVAFKNMEISFRSFDEKLIPLMQEENRLTNRYNKLIATAKIDWDGEELNLSLLRPYRAACGLRKIHGIF